MALKRKNDLPYKRFWALACQQLEKMVGKMTANLEAVERDAERAEIRTLLLAVAASAALVAADAANAQQRPPIGPTPLPKTAGSTASSGEG